MNEDQPARPANIANIVAINQGKRALTMGEPQAAALKLRRFSELMGEGRLVIDCRSAAAYGSGHIPGAYNIQLSNSEFEQRVGWVTPLDVPMLLVMEQESDVQNALRALAFVGLDWRFEGYLMGGMGAWIDAGMPHQTVTQISVHRLNAALQSGPDGAAMQPLDVRETSEWDEGHISAAAYMNYKTMGQRIDELKVPRDQPLAVLCARGFRSSTACSLLLMNGFQRVYNVTGGMTAWEAAGLPVVDADGIPL